AVQHSGHRSVPDRKRQASPGGNDRSRRILSSELAVARRLDRQLRQPLGGSLMRPIPFIAAVVSLLMSGLCFAQDWIEYRSQADFFSVNFPAEPKVRDISYRTEYSLTLPGRMYSYENGPTRYSVTVIDYANLESMEAERVKSCRAAGGDGDTCNDHSM